MVFGEYTNGGAAALLASPCSNIFHHSGELGDAVLFMGTRVDHPTNGNTRLTGPACLCILQRRWLAETAFCDYRGDQRSRRDIERGIVHVNAVRCELDVCDVRQFARVAFFDLDGATIGTL